jgi:peptidoglycan hydrolase-like protein with peptidoglycan-binding domain
MKTKLKSSKYQSGGLLNPLTLLPIPPDTLGPVKPFPQIDKQYLNMERIHDLRRRLSKVSYKPNLTLEERAALTPYNKLGVAKSKSKDRFTEHQTGGTIDAEAVSEFPADKLKAVQLDLKNRKLYKGNIDGVYGRLTEQAINEYNNSAKRFAPTGVLPEFTIIAPKQNSSKTEALSNLKSMEQSSGLQLFPLWESTGKPNITAMSPYQEDQRAFFLSKSNTMALPASEYVTIADVTENTGYAPRITKLPKGALLTEYSKMGAQDVNSFVAESTHAEQLKDKGLAKYSGHNTRSF